MRMSVDWNNLSFKAKDIIAFIAGVAVLIFLAGATNQKLNTIIENQSENKELFNKISDRLYDVERKQDKYESEQNALKIRVEAWENTRSYK